MSTKLEAEHAFKQLFVAWGKELVQGGLNTDGPSFSDFRIWVETRGYAHYFEFRSVRGAVQDVESWFDRHFAQNW